MKRLLSTLIPVVVALPIVASAQPTVSNCQYGNQTVSSVLCFGAADLEGTNVTGDVTVFGPLTMHGATVNKVTVMGELKSSDSTAKGPVSVYGPIFANTSTFDKDVFSATNYMQMQASKINGNVTIKSSSQQGVLDMSNGSLVTGNVDFSAQSGVVKLDGSSHVDGNIINGTTKPNN